jgi:hypothetical protein
MNTRICRELPARKLAAPSPWTRGFRFSGTLNQRAITVHDVARFIKEVLDLAFSLLFKACLDFASHLDFTAFRLGSNGFFETPADEFVFLELLEEVCFRGKECLSDTADTEFKKD